VTSAAPPTEEEFRALAASCDRLLADPGAPPEWIATQWLHVLSHHPVVLERYRDAFEAMRGRTRSRPPDARGALATASLLARALLARRRWMPPGPFDVVFVSRIGSRADLEREADLMFGDLPARLAAAGVRSATLLRDHTGTPPGSLARAAYREGPTARALLPDARSFAEEARGLLGTLRARRRMSRAATRAPASPDRIVAREAARHMRPAVVAEGLRLGAQVAAACRAWRPRVLAVTYEGHAWEKCAAAAATAVDPRIAVVGYQHTLMWPMSHAPLRRLRRARGLDPDIVLTSGEVTRGWLAASPALAGTEIRVLGSYRRPRRIEARPSSDPAVIVLPDGFRSESVALFGAAIDAARLVPDVPFILRPHPVVPFWRIAAELGPLPRNVAVSAEPDLDRDLARSGAVLYRGSSTVVTAVLAGAKPYYLELPGEMTIDLLAEVEGWREHVRTGADLAQRHARHLRAAPDHAEGWEHTRAYCERSLMPIDESAVRAIAGLARGDAHA
jgi:hypothetical protein